MQQIRTTRPQPFSLAHCFERSRLEVDFLVAAYALIVPVLQRPLTSSGTSTMNNEKAQAHHERDQQAGGARA